MSIWAVALIKALRIKRLMQLYDSGLAGDSCVLTDSQNNMRRYFQGIIQLDSTYEWNAKREIGHFWLMIKIISLQFTEAIGLISKTYQHAT